MFEYGPMLWKIDGTCQTCMTYWVKWRSIYSYVQNESHYVTRKLAWDNKYQTIIVVSANGYITCNVNNLNSLEIFFITKLSHEPLARHTCINLQCLCNHQASKLSYHHYSIQKHNFIPSAFSVTILNGIIDFKYKERFK